MGGEPGQHQLRGGGPPRRLGGLVQGRLPAAVGQQHQRPDPPHAHRQLPGGDEDSNRVFCGRFVQLEMCFLEKIEPKKACFVSIMSRHREKTVRFRFFGASSRSVFCRRVSSHLVLFVFFPSPRSTPILRTTLEATTARRPT